MIVNFFRKLNASNLISRDEADTLPWTLPNSPINDEKVSKTQKLAQKIEKFYQN